MTSDIGAAAADPEVLLTTEDAIGDESDPADENDPGIDGDLSTDEPSDLIAHIRDELDPPTSRVTHDEVGAAIRG